MKPILTTMLALLAGSSAFAQIVAQDQTRRLKDMSECDGQNPGACKLPSSLNESIIVTARGRDELVGRVPDTITLFNAELKSRRMEDANTILNAAPGVFFVSDTDPGTNVISIRGISTNRGQDPSVAVIFDDHILPDGELFTLKPLDLARAEIIKGPQGALFGKSATGGAVRFVSVQPGQGNNYVRAGAGNGGSVSISGAAGGQLSNTVAVRLAADVSDSSGFIRNTTLSKKVDGFQSINVRLAGTLMASDTLTVSPAVRYTREKGGAAFVSSNNVTQQFAGRLAGAALTDPIGDFEGRADRTYLGATVSITYDFDSARLRSTTSYDDYQKDFVEELDFRPTKPLTFFGFPAFPNGIQPIAQPVDIKAWTQELRLTSADDADLRWIVGGFYQQTDKLRTDDFTGFGTFLAEKQKSRQTALFASVDTDIASTLTLSGAIRYDRVRKTQTQRNRAGVVTGSRTATFDVVEPKLSIAWRPAPDWMLYGNASTGYKPGGFNPPSAFAPNAPVIFASEKTKGAELGVKGRAGNLTVTAAGYLARHSNFQNTVFLDNNLVFSIPRVKISGAEATMAYSLNGGFSVDASASFTGARLATYTVANPTVESPEPLAQCRGAGGTLCDFTGNRIPYSPSRTLQAGTQWQGEMGAYRLLLRGDVSHTGRIYFETDNVLFTPARTVVDARLALSRGNIEASFWAKNLTDRRWALAAFGQQNLLLLNALGPGGPFDSFTINKGRQWGADVKVTF
jgi:iron complex outermembrane recepter protein